MIKIWSELFKLQKSDFIKKQWTTTSMLDKRLQTVRF